ncbi:MAG: glycosyltransferase [Kiritimatiellia bacterium]|nr:glycosyltransferase [Kiritimatiellia bacterium]
MFYPRALWIGGGGETLVRRIREYLPKTGHTTEYFNQWEPQSNFDLLHIIACNAEILEFATVARERGMNVILSSFEYRPWGGVRLAAGRTLCRLLSSQSNQVRRSRVLPQMNRITANSPAMKTYLMRYYGVEPRRCDVVPRGVDQVFFEASPNIFTDRFGVRDFVLCVGRISQRKNQLRILRSLSRAGLNVVFIGGPEPMEEAYIKAFTEELKRHPHSLWIRDLAHNDPLLASAYAACRVHIQASVGLPEYPGLANVEAAAAGARVVATRNPVTEYYLGNEVDYCRAGSESDIRRAVLGAMERADTQALQQHVRQFHWDQVIHEVVRSYERVLEDD